MKGFLVTVCVVLFSLVGRAQTMIDFEPFASGLNSVIDVVNAGDSMLYAVEQAGIIKLIDPDGSVRSTPFLDIRDRVNDGASERGLLGLVFHPVYPDSPYLYINYTANNGGATTISRFEVNENDATQAVPASEKILLSIDQPFTNHNAGDLIFGPDGYLYIPTGDGGSGNDPQRNGQNLMSLLAKMLRIDVDNGSPYAIPTDNPFVDDSLAANEIWAYGLRNPWRVDFDPQTGEFYIADVGQNAFEEIDVQPAASAGGENYGWRCFEGNNPHRQDGCPADGFTFPVYEYPHNNTQGCRASISGGVVYRGSEFPGLNGKYIFGDFCTGFVGVLYRDANMNWQSDTVAQFSPFSITSFGRDIDGEVYMVATGSGEILKVVDVTSSVSTPNTFGQLIIQNPVQNVLTLKSNISFDTAVLMALDGKIVHEFLKNEKEIRVSHLASGIYIIKMQSGSQLFIQRIIII